MPVTAIQRVVNNSKNKLLFINSENSKNNRYVDAETTQGVDNCWVPWCGAASNFPARNILIIDAATHKVLFYMWQDHGTGGEGDFVRRSTSGWASPTHSNRLPGFAEAGYKIDVLVEMKDGVFTITGTKVAELTKAEIESAQTAQAGRG